MLIPVGLIIIGLVLSVVRSHAKSRPFRRVGDEDLEDTDERKELHLLFELLDLNHNGELDKNEVTTTAVDECEGKLGRCSLSLAAARLRLPFSVIL